MYEGMRESNVIFLFSCGNFSCFLKVAPARNFDAMRCDAMRNVYTRKDGGEREREPVIINMKIAFCVSFVRLFYVIRMDRPNYFCFTPVNYARE